VIRALERTGLAWDVRRPSPVAVARRRRVTGGASTPRRPRLSQPADHL
jgi:hypothetical protein